MRTIVTIALALVLGGCACQPVETVATAAGPTEQQRQLMQDILYATPVSSFPLNTVYGLR